jgi:hypothetical protein
LTLVYNTKKLNADLTPIGGAAATTSSSAAGAAATASVGTLPAGFKSASSSLVAEGTIGRALISASTTSSSMTPGFCASYCTNLGYPISGTEYSSEWYVSPPSAIFLRTPY